MNEKEIIDHWLNMEQQQPIQPATQNAYWQHYRIQAAIAAMQAELTNPNNVFSMCDDKLAIIAKRAIRYADALIDELKKGGK